MESLEASEEGTCSEASFHNPNQDVRMAVHGDDFEDLPDDGLTSSPIQIHSERHGNTRILRFRHEKSSIVESCIQCGVDQTGHYLDIEPDLRHARSPTDKR